MLKRDRIFYAACALCGAGLVLAIMGYEFAILLFVAAYLLRPTLHESGLARQYADERQLLIHSRSGNIAFIIVILTAVGLALWRVSRGEPAEHLYELICIGLAARAITGLVMSGEYRKAGAVIIGAIGVFLGLFVLLDGGWPAGVVAGSVIALAFVGLARLALAYPRPMAFVGLLIILGAILFFGLWQFRTVQTALWLFFVTPLTIATTCLMLGSRDGDEGVSPELRTRVFGSLAAAAAVVFTLLILFGDRGREEYLGGGSNTVREGEVIEMQGIPCTGRIETFADGTLEACTLARDFTVNGQPLPVGTVVTFEPNGDFDWCFLQQTTEIQGHLCRGKGHNFMTCFHPNGVLRLAWLAEDEVIDGIQCGKFTFRAAFFADGGGAHFHDDGRLKRCHLSEDAVIEGRSFERYDVVEFDEAGRLVERKE